jgi:hypothetical protein
MSVFLSMKDHWITAKGDRSFWTARSTARQALSRDSRKSALAAWRTEDPDSCALVKAGS